MEGRPGARGRILRKGERGKEGVLGGRSGGPLTLTTPEGQVPVEKDKEQKARGERREAGSVRSGLRTLRARELRQVQAGLGILENLM